MNTFRFRFFAASLLLLTAGLLFADVKVSATQTGPNFIVNSLADSDDGSCDAAGQGSGNKDCTLREAINAAANYGDGAVINFNLSGTVTLGSQLPTISTSMTIDGNGQAVTIDGNNGVQAFYLRGLAENPVVNFNALTFAHNSTAIYAYFGNPMVTNCTFDSNSVNADGSAIRISDNSQDIYVANSTFYNNTAWDGTIYYATYTNSLHLYVLNCTFYGNIATISSQLGPVTGVQSDSGVAVLENCIFAGGKGGSNCKNVAASSSMADDTSCNGATQVTAASLQLDSALRTNGGPTRTLALLSGSVAINAGSAAVCKDPRVNNLDQRGSARDSYCDNGAYEYGSTGSLVVNTTSDSTSTYDRGNSLRKAIAYANSLGSGVISFDPSLAGQTITLSNGWNGTNDDSALRVTGSVAVVGPLVSPGVTIAMAQGVSKRHFFVESSGSLNISELTLTGGSGDFGGSIRGVGPLTVDECTFTNNHASLDGGAIHGDTDEPYLWVQRSTFVGNSSATYSSAIASGAQQTRLTYITVTGNTAPNDTGGAILLYQYPTMMIDSIVAGNTPDGIILENGGSFAAGTSYNILGSGSSGGLVNGTSGNQVGVAPNLLHLSPLANNGGPTPTIALQAGSVALDAGIAVANFPIDQRGSSRTVDDPTIANAAGGDGTDIGAVEMNRIILGSLASRQIHNGVGALDVTLPLSGRVGTESRSGGPSGSFELVFTFTNPIASVGTASLTNGTGTVNSTTIGSDPHQVLVVLSTVTDAQTLTIGLPSLTDSTGAQSDLLFASMGVLLGDVNGDGAVNSGDATIARSYSGQSVSSADQSSIRCDVNLDGAINSADATVVRNHSGNSDGAPKRLQLIRGVSIEK